MIRSLFLPILLDFLAFYLCHTEKADNLILQKNINTFALQNKQYLGF